MDGNVFNIKTADNLIIAIPKAIKRMSKAFSSMTNDLIDINLDINSLQLSHIIEYCDHHKYTNPPEIIRPLQFNDLKKCVNDIWDAEFMLSMDFDKIIDLLNAANLLEIASLIDLCYASLALYFRTTPINELKNKFMLTDTEFTEQDVNEIKEGNKWLMLLTEDRLKELD